MVLQVSLLILLFIIQNLSTISTIESFIMKENPNISNNDAIISITRIPIDVMAREVHRRDEQYSALLITTSLELQRRIESWRYLLESKDLTNQINITNAHTIHRQLFTKYYHLYSSLPQLHLHNQQVLLDLLTLGLRESNFQFVISNSESTQDKRNEEESNYGKFEQLLSHLTRDWSEDGSQVQAQLYHKLVTLLESYHTRKPQDTSSKALKVLIPGCGLGRLGLELILKGYQVELNEISSNMLLSIHGLIQMIKQNQSITIYPHIHYNPTNNFDQTTKMQGISIPNPRDPLSLYLRQWLLSQPNESSDQRLYLNLGAFEDIYSGDSQYDVFLTCFFIDTLNINLVDLLARIVKILRSGGTSLWINSGPLQYHHETSICYTYDDIIELARSFRLEAIHEERLEVNYCGEEKYSMKPEHYHIPITVFRLVDDEVIRDKDTNVEEELELPLPKPNVDYILMHN